MRHRALKFCRQVFPLAMALAMVMVLPLAFAHSAESVLPPPDQPAPPRVLYIIPDPEYFNNDTTQVLLESRAQIAQKLHDERRVRTRYEGDSKNTCAERTEKCHRIIIEKQGESVFLTIICPIEGSGSEPRTDIASASEVNRLGFKIARVVGVHEERDKLVEEKHKKSGP